MNVLTSAAAGERLSLLLALIVALTAGTLLLEVALYWFLTKVVRTRHALAFTLLGPAVIALVGFTLYPLVYNVGLAFSDLRLKTIPCYMPNSELSNKPCPFIGPEQGASVQTTRDLALYTEPGDQAATVGTAATGITVTVLQQGQVGTPAAPTANGTPSTGGFSLGGPLPGETATPEATPTAPTDDRVWWQVQTSDGQKGWVPESIDSTTTLKRASVLYSVGYGLQNLRDVFFDTDSKTGQIIGWGRLLRTEGSTFPVLLVRTAIWTILNVIFHFLIGFGLALVLNGKVRFKGVYRAIILIPWAIPQVIAALTWKQEFHAQYGFVNGILSQFGLQPVSWLQQPVPAFIAVLFVNVWLGVPFYMVVLLGGLQSISREYYEAAEMDGATVRQRLFNITLPLIRTVAVPIVTLDAIWTFNQFNVIYLITGGEPAESTNILVTALYNAAFGPNGTFRLGFAAAFSLLIFAILLVMATIWVRSSGALKGVYD